MAENLTQRAIDKALKDTHTNAEVRLYDGKVKGLLLWRRGNGSPRWYLFKRVGGRMRRLPVSEPADYPAVSLEMARGAAEILVATWAKGSDPAQERRAVREKHLEELKEKQGKATGIVPFKDVVAYVIGRMGDKARSDRHIVERQRIADGIAAAGLKDLTDPRACTIAEGWIKKQKCSLLTKHRYGQHIRAIGRAAARKFDLLHQRDPFLSLEVGSPAIPVPVAFSLDEVIKLASDKAMATEWGRLFTFLLLSGCRMREGMYARWSRIDLGTATFLVLPPSAKEREGGEAVKRNKARTVTLQGELIEILRRWQKHRGVSDFLFKPEVQTTSFITTIRFREHLTTLGIPVENDGKSRHIHTLRHTHVALSVACGVGDLALRLSVGHGGAEMSAHYATMAMLWKAKLAPWQGAFHLRDPTEVARLAPNQTTAKTG
jgi:integrase